MASNPATGYLSTADCLAALNALEPGDWIRLEKKASYYALGTGVEGRDLLNESIVRTLSGEDRFCPVDVPFPVYLANAMRSIADGQREKFDREPPSGEPHDEASPVGQHADPRPSPESIVATGIDFKKVTGRLQEIFADDPEVLAVIIGEMDGWSAEDIKQMEGMDDKAYATARKRMRRAIDREFGGTKP